jgi:hypothetical protein
MQTYSATGVKFSDFLKIEKIQASFEVTSGDAVK